MKIAVLGTGIVGRGLGEKLLEIGHEVVIGTRDPGALLARSEPDARGFPPFSDWHAQHLAAGLETFEGAAAQGDLVVNATAGERSLAALRSAGAHNLSGKILIDVANPLDFSQGMPPTLTVSNTDSLAEQIQREFPGARVVKTLNTVNVDLMVNPRSVGDGEHHIFVSGNDPAAKADVTTMLRDWFGWRHVIDLGDITTARGAEMYLPLWVRMLTGLGTASFNIRVVT